MKIRYLKFKNWLIVTAMSILGLTACRHSKEMAAGDKGTKEPHRIDENVLVPMYGVPQREYADSNAVTQSPADSQQPAPTVVPPQPREPQVTVYGVPTVDFCVKGRVTDPNGKPVKGMQVILIDSRIDPDNLPDNEYWKSEMRRMSDTTDEKGNFEVNGSDRPWETMRVLVRDIDGSKNGSFQNQLVDVQFGDPENGDKPVSQWNLGTKNAEVAIKMKRKKK